MLSGAGDCMTWSAGGNSSSDTDEIAPDVPPKAPKKLKAASGGGAMTGGMSIGAEPLAAVASVARAPFASNVQSSVIGQPIGIPLFPAQSPKKQAATTQNAAPSRWRMCILDRAPPRRQMNSGGNKANSASSATAHTPPLPAVAPPSAVAPIPTLTSSPAVLAPTTTFATTPAASESAALAAVTSERPPAAPAMGATSLGDSPGMAQLMALKPAEEPERVAEWMREHEASGASLETQIELHKEVAVQTQFQQSVQATIEQLLAMLRAASSLDDPQHSAHVLLLRSQLQQAMQQQYELQGRAQASLSQLTMHMRKRQATLARCHAMAQSNRDQQGSCTDRGRS